MNKTQLRQKIKKEIFQRSVIIERSAVSEEKRTVEIAFSSEDPYRRWYGVEILGHEKDEVDMEFMASGRAPFLSGHNHSDQIAVIEKAWIDNDRVGRAVVRFGKGARAEELFQDVIDGIRQNISVGYSIVEAKLIEEHEDDPDVYRMKWRPFEASLVSVPADTTVGVGRSDDKKIKYEKGNVVMKDNEKGEIEALGKHHGFEKEASEAIEKGYGVEQFRAFVLDELKKKTPKPIGNFVPELQRQDEKENSQNFSLIKLIASQIPGSNIDAGREFEICKETRKKNPNAEYQGFAVPLSALGSQQRDITLATGAAGGNLVATQLQAGSFAESLRNRCHVIKMGATVLNDLVGDIDIPTQLTGATPYYVGEVTQSTESSPTFGKKSMSPTRVGTWVDVSKKAIQQSSIALEQFVKNDIANAIAVGVDAMAINGSGSSDEPTGILQTSGIGAVVGGTNGAIPTYDHVIDLETEVSVDNADIGALGYLTNSKIRGSLKKMFTNSTYGETPLWTNTISERNQAMGILNGYRAGASNNVPSDFDKGTSTGVCSAIIYGNWKDLIIGYWGGLDIVVDPYTLAREATVRITAHLFFDVAIRRAESFAAMQDALTA
jgi:HK97 family phage major capsid protein